MRTRAFRPEAPGCLEDRSLFSGVVGLSADPVVLTSRQLNVFVEQVRTAFNLFGREFNFTDLSSGLGDATPFLPFGQVDLDAPMRRIVDELRHDFIAHVPHATRTAYEEILGLARADMAARVRAGDVVRR